MARLVADGQAAWRTVGGDHGSVYGAIAAHAQAYPGLGILHLDAHADLRDAYEGFTWSHASIFHNVVRAAPGGVARWSRWASATSPRTELALIASSDGRRGHPLFDPRAAAARASRASPGRDRWTASSQELPEQVYLSFDIDGLDPTLCPHTGTPVPGGLSFPRGHRARRRRGALGPDASWAST